ncbi:hypothetical protein [Conexibacter sp. SYSU D00693]|uniref:hypothetical protein n=1 Tax=Conexibacter sp. SYSU D00693 TaxID=2812560 RepID=UPI00196B1564|nr:hypothetical protein [Conexibacter sp. SYSU D00693]
MGVTIEVVRRVGAPLDAGRVPAWARLRRHAANGRLEVACRAPGADHLFWLAERELSWSCCPHCAGWFARDPVVDAEPLGVPVAA